MVWFYRFCLKELYASVFSFNPTMVWFYLDEIEEMGIGELDDIYAEDDRIRIVLRIVDEDFQSHYGLILSLLLRVSQPLCKSFNPTMVWFYLDLRQKETKRRKRLSIPLWSDFITALAHPEAAANAAFNPTMVWFYHNLIDRSKNKIINLSIPLWSDFIS